MREPLYLYAAQVTNVVDGDTVDVKLNVGFYLNYMIRIRLLRINASELHSPDPAERLLAIEAKNFVVLQVLGKSIVIQTFKSDAFGRWLGEIWYVKNGVELNLSDELLRLNLAQPFMVKIGDK